MRFRSEKRGQLVLASGVAMAFSILMIASMTMLFSQMDADRNIEPALGPEFSHVHLEFERALIYNYNHTSESGSSVFNSTAPVFEVMEMHYGLNLDFTLLNVTGSPDNETVSYRITLRSEGQVLEGEFVVVLRR